MIQCTLSMLAAFTRTIRRGLHLAISSKLVCLSRNDRGLSNGSTGVYLAAPREMREVCPFLAGGPGSGPQHKSWSSTESEK